MKNGAQALIAVSLLGLIVFSILIGLLLAQRPEARPRTFPSYQELSSRNGGVRPTQPCENMRGREESELCAQWVSANAAAQMATLTERQFWVGIVTLIGLAATVWLTLKGARAAENTLAHAQAMADAQLRAYVSPGRFVIADIGNDRYRMTVPVRNSGQTPARNVKTSMRCWYRSLPLDPHLPSMKLSAKWHILGPHTERFSMIVRKLTTAQVHAIRQKKACLLVRHQVAYTTHSGQEVMEPCFNMVATGESFDTEALKLLKPSQFSDPEAGRALL